MHIIFQRHHIAPDEFLKKDRWVQVFMLESMKIQIKNELKARNKDGIIEEEDDD